MKYYYNKETEKCYSEGEYKVLREEWIDEIRGFYYENKPSRKYLRTVFDSEYVEIKVKLK